MQTKTTNTDLTLLIGGNGKTGRRVAERLRANGHAVRIGSRFATPAFDWYDQSTWSEALRDISNVYITFYPDLAVPAAPPAISAFTKMAKAANVQRLVLLSGRGEVEARKCEQIVLESGIEATIVRCSFFAQNFSEDFFHDLVMSGTVALPVDTVREGFVDADDIADVVAAALTENGHAGEVYELTGPRLMTFAQAITTIATAAGREVNFVPVTREQFKMNLTEIGLSGEFIDLLNYLFTEILDGRNEYLADGVQRALGREPRDFTEYARNASAQGAWHTSVATH